MKTQIEASAKYLTNQIRAFVKSKAKYWKMVPYCALYADGKSGFDNQYNWAYHYKIWKIDDKVGVNLCNYEIINPYNKDYRIASDSYVIEHAFYLHRFDGELIFKTLFKEAQAPQMSYITENIGWREKAIRNFKIEIPTILSLM